MKYTTLGCTLVAATLITSLTVIPGFATDTVKLTTVSGYAKTAAWVQIFEEVYVPEVNKRLSETNNYEIDWSYGWGGAIVGPKGELEAIETGLADIGVVQTVFHPDKLRVYDIAFATPFVSIDLDLITKTVNNLTAEFPAMQDVWKQNGLEFLTTLAAVDNYQILLDGAYEGTESLKGKKIGGAGMNLRYVESVGATGVSSTLADFYNGVASGLFDGVIAWATAAEAFKLYEPASTYVKVDFGGVNSMALAVNESVWAGLPAEVQTALRDSAEVYRKALADFAMNEAASSVKDMEANGATVIQVSQEERLAWANGMTNIAKEWAAEVEQTGAPGNEILTAYIQAMRDANQTILRDWSAE